MPFLNAIPQLRTTNIDETIDFYTSKIGFTVEFRYQDFYAGIRAGRQVFHLKQVDAKDPSIDFVANGGHFHLYLETDDIVATAADLRSRGVQFVRDVCETPWGTREFVISDDQGHTIYIGESVES